MGLSNIVIVFELGRSATEGISMSSSYLVLARTEDALSISKAESLKKWPHVIDLVDMVPLAKLCVLLTGDKYDAVIDSFIKQTPDQPDVESWDFENLISPVFLIPDSCVRAIAGMRAEDLPALSETWSKIEEFKWYNYDLSDITDQLVRLRKFSAECIKKKKSMLLLLTT